MASFVYRRSSDGVVLDPSRALGDMVRAALRLDPAAGIAIMQMQCGSCGDPDCGDVETVVQIATGDGRHQALLRIAKAMRQITAEDLVAALSRPERRPAP